MPDEEKVESEEVKEEQVEEVKEEQVEESKEEKDLISQEDRNILALLKNPTTATLLIKSLAEQHGLTLGETSSKDVEKTLTNELKEVLGDEWAFLAEKLGPVIEKQVGKVEKTIRNELSDSDKRQSKTTFQKAEKQFFKDNPEARAYTKRMANLASKYPPQEDADYDEYLGDLFTLAAGRKGSITDAVEKKKQARIAKNRDSEDVRSSSSSKYGDKKSKMSLDDSISAAIKAVVKED
jgi:hypothetical protein